MVYLEGIPISPGFASGIAVVYDFEVGRKIEVVRSNVLSSEVESEWDRLDKALEKSHQDLQLLELTASKQPNLRKSLAILSTHAAMTRQIADLVKQHVGRELVNAEAALDSVICNWVERLQRLDSEYLRQREQDVRDVGRRMTRYLAGTLPWSKGPLPPGSIVVARELLPSEVIELANCGVAAIVSERGGSYSHTAILARALGIPAVTRILHATSQIRPGVQLLIDGQAGSVTIAPSNSGKNFFMQQMKKYQRLVAATVAAEKLPCATQDDIEISLLANISLPKEIQAVEQHGLDGVGLFRTEFLFFDSHERPSLQSQREIYDKMAKELDGRPLVIRTFELGGDKLPPFLLMSDAKSYRSFHLRGLRFSLSERDLLDTQLHAILHVAQTSDVRILFPMVIGTDDLKQAIAGVDRIVEEHGFLRTPPIGAMVETPAALFVLDELFDLVDFVAIGTNDLTQYLLATDWDLTGAADDCSALHPAVLKALKQVIDTATQHQCPVYVCGEEAGDISFACLLVGLGIRTLSLTSSREAIVREALRGISSTAAANTALQALRCHSQSEVRELLAELRPITVETPPSIPRPLLEY